MYLLSDIAHPRRQDCRVELNCKPSKQNFDIGFSSFTSQADVGSRAGSCTCRVLLVAHYGRRSYRDPNLRLASPRLISRRRGLWAKHRAKRHRRAQMATRNVGS
jgi:hypothetical protein